MKMIPLEIDNWPLFKMRIEMLDAVHLLEQEEDWERLHMILRIDFWLATLVNFIKTYNNNRVVDIDKDIVSLLEMGGYFDEGDD